jgi:hypothetical protein
VHAKAVEVIPVGQGTSIQHAGVPRITLNALPYSDIFPSLHNCLVVGVFALVDGTVEIVLHLPGAELLLVPGAADVIPLLELFDLVILELLDQVVFSPTKSLLARVAYRPTMRKAVGSTPHLSTDF